MKEKLVLITFAVICILNVISFIAYGVDKRKAVKGAFRIPEATLLLFAVIGPMGALIGMRTFRHKTQKPKFFIGVPLILIFEVGVLIFLVNITTRT